MMSDIERTLGQILANQANHTGWLRSIDAKVSDHVTTPHASVEDVKANTRGRYMVIGAITLISLIGTVLAMVG